MAEKTHPLVCKQCGYANEGERVYCHNCGTKLDRTLLPSMTAPEESLEKKQKRIRKIVTPKRGFFAGSGKTFAITMLGSLLCAVVILIIMPPDDVPAPAKADDLLESTIAMDLETAVESNQAEKWSATQSDINNYLQLKFKSGGPGFLGGMLSFSRLFVNLDEDLIRITTQQSAFGLPLYCQVDYRLAIVNNKLVATVKGGSIGRLRIHPNLMNSAATIFQKIWDMDEMKRDKRLLDQCQSVEVHKDHVDAITKPGT